MLLSMFVLTFILNRKTLSVVTGILLAGGTAAYVQSRRQRKSNSHKLIPENSQGESNGNGPDTQNRQKKSNLKSLQVLNAILLSRMGTQGLQNIMLLIATTVCLFHSVICFLP